MLSKVYITTVTYPHLKSRCALQSIPSWAIVQRLKIGNARAKNSFRQSGKHSTQVPERGSYVGNAGPGPGDYADSEEGHTELPPRGVFLVRIWPTVSFRVADQNELSESGTKRCSS